jgi:hypothetical protein
MATWKRLQGYGDDVTGSFSGTLDSSEFPMAAMVTGANANDVKSTLSLNNVANENRATILGGNLTGTIATSVTVGGTAMSTVKSGAALGGTANQDTTAEILGGDLTGEVNGVAVATISGGAARANAGLASNGDVSRAVPEAKGGTGLTSADTLLNSAISIGADGSLSGAGGGQVTKAGIGVSDANYLNENTTKADVGLSSVIDQAITVAGGKLKFGSAQQTIDADKIGGSTLAETKAAAVATVLGTGTPANLDTLRDISDALGDTASLGVTLVNSIGAKQQKAATGINPATSPSQDVGTIGYDSSNNPWIVVA